MIRRRKKKQNIFLHFSSFIFVPVNMMNVTRVTLSHNRIACKLIDKFEDKRKKFKIQINHALKFIYSNSAWHRQFDEFRNFKFDQ